MGCDVQRRYYDIIHPENAKQAPADDRDAEEIAADFMRRHGLKTADEPQE